MINMEKTKKRLTNLDLLKVISMIMIVCLHYLNFGGILQKATFSDGNFYIAQFIEQLCIVGVNCFILCSGYLMAKNHFRFSKLIYLWLQIISFTVIFFIIALITKNGKFSLDALDGVFLPINARSYWYMSAYFAFYLLSPLLIWMNQKLTTNQLKKLVIALIVMFSISPWQWTNIDSGYHFVWFCILFFVAAYIRRADLFKRESKSYFGYYLLLTLILYVIEILVLLISKKVSAFGMFTVRRYCLILTLLSSLLLFAAFKNMKIKHERIGTFITFLSSLTLGVYLIHENEYVRDILWQKVVQPLNVFDKPYFILHLIGSVLAVFFVCAFLEYFRQLLFKFFNIPSLCDKLGDKVQSLADKIFDSHIIEKL